MGEIVLLKSLNLQGFKTFPEKTKLSFGPGITAVVGPNGSGKSNISDAIRWVLGEQSTKTLRCSKMEDVIFGGTPLRKSQGFAEVTLTVDNSDRRIPFDSDEVAITRRYYRSGESEYMINKASVRLKDIHELFMDTGLGRDGYSMISQGKIDSVVSSKSEDRREIFEEAAGISKHRYRKLEAEKRLKQAEENLIRLRDIIIELEDRIGPLKIQSEKAKKYLNYSNEKKSLEIGIWLNTLNKFSMFLVEQEDKISIAQNQHNSIEAEVKIIEDNIENIFSMTNSFAADIDKIRREISSFEESAFEKQGKISVLENDILHNKENINRIKNEIESISLLDKDFDKEIEDRKSQILQKEDSLSGKKLDLEKFLSELDNIKQGMNEFSDVIDNLSKELSKNNLEISDVKVNCLTASSSINDVNSRLLYIKNNIDVKNNRIIELEQKHNDYLSMKKNADLKFEELSNKIKGYEFKFKLQKEKCEKLKNENDKLNLDFQEIIRRIKLLEELDKNLEGFTKSVKVVINESKKGNLFGIHGPVSKLIKVLPKYSVAIETALGAAMQNIVVGNENDAKRAISLLKNKDCGRATFLPLSTIKGFEIKDNELKLCEGFIGIASQLCTCKEEYKNILYSLLGRIVIVKTLDEAVVISKKLSYKYRVVTLDGQVVNAGGSLTGGSLSRNSGLLSRASEIDKLKSESDNLKLKTQESSEKLKCAKEELAYIEANLLGTKGDLSNVQEEKIKIDAECRNCKTELESENNSLNEIKEENAELLLKIKELENIKQVSEDKYNELKIKISDIEKEITSITGERNGMNEKREEILSKIQDIRFNILSDEKDIESIKSDIESINLRKINQNSKVEALNVEIKDLDEYNKSIYSNIDITKSEVEELKNRSKEYKLKIEDLNEKRSECEKKSIELRNLEKEKTIQREAIGRDLSRLEEKKISLQKEYDDIITKLWEEYELTKREAEEISEKIDNISDAKKRLNELKLKIKNLGTINVSAIEEYKSVSERYEFMTHQVNDVEKSKLELSKLINDLTSQMKEMFLTRFNEINKNFSETFNQLFGGGKSNLSLTDPDNILSSGIDISVQPPGKIVSHLEALSGGEKALVAIALYFAIMKVSPAPFCVLDEIEAALDDVNVDRYASYLRKMNDNTQFIVITHRRGTMEEADVLYGVTMQDEGISKLLELKVSEVEKQLGVKV